jgi:hypothetical protein
MQFDGGTLFPARAFETKRCFLVTRVSVEGGGEFVLVNTRFSSFQGAGEARDAEFAQMKTFLEQEASQGHFVVVGADWSHQLPGADYGIFGHNQLRPVRFMDIPESFTPDGYHWAVDPTVPSRRNLDKPYVRGETFTLVADGFLLSGNVELVSVRTQDLDFQNAAHNPVKLEFKLGRV